MFFYVDLERRGKLKLRILYHTVQCGPDKVIDILLEGALSKSAGWPQC